MIEVLCVGQLVADILVRPVDRVDFDVDTRQVETIELKNGGDGLNTAIGLGRLGHRVGFAGLIGRDHWGRFLEGVIDEAGVDRRGLKRADGAGTSAVIVLINPAGERTFLYRGGTNELLTVEDLDWSLVAEASVVHVGGTFLLPRFDGPGAARLFETARAAGKITSMDVTWDVTGRWLPIIRPCLPHLSWFLPSRAEAYEITGRSRPEDMAAFLQEEGVENVVIKLGGEGCYVRPAGGPGFTVPAFSTAVVDTTGAGDSFVAGFLAGRIRGWDLPRCARLACAAAALTIQKVGATAGAPTFEEARRLMKRGEQGDL